MVNLERFFLFMKLVNELIDLKCLHYRLFLILHGWQNLVDFMVDFL